MDYGARDVCVNMPWPHKQAEWFWDSPRYSKSVRAVVTHLPTHTHRTGLAGSHHLTMECDSDSCSPLAPPSLSPVHSAQFCSLLANWHNNSFHQGLHGVLKQSISEKHMKTLWHMLFSLWSSNGGIVRRKISISYQIPTWCLTFWTPCICGQSCNHLVKTEQGFVNRTRTVSTLILFSGYGLRSLPCNGQENGTYQMSIQDMYCMTSADLTCPVWAKKFGLC